MAEIIRVFTEIHLFSADLAFEKIKNKRCLRYFLLKRIKTQAFYVILIFNVIKLLRFMWLWFETLRYRFRSALFLIKIWLHFKVYVNLSMCLAAHFFFFNFSKFKSRKGSIIPHDNRTHYKSVTLNVSYLPEIELESIQHVVADQTTW